MTLNDRVAAWTTVPPVCEECAPAIPIDLATSNQFGEIDFEQFRDYQHLPLSIDASVIEGGNIWIPAAQAEK
jgi:hypothetical protein